MTSSRSFDFDALRAHEPFARRLARSLLGDAAAADDAVQEAWLCALRSPPRPEGNLRNWFLKVTGNVVRQALRRDARRERRERSCGDESPLPSPDQVIAREAMRRTVLEALFALEEPYRSTLIWTFLEDLSAADLARRLGVPTSTVRNRVKRGLERLRQDLDRSASQRDWRSGLVPWLGVARAGGEFWSVGTPLKGAAKVGAVLTHQSLVVPVLVLALSFTWWTQWSDESTSVAPASSLPPSEDRVSIAANVPAEALRPERMAVPHATAGEADSEVLDSMPAELAYGGVRGILRRADGSAAAGVEVVVVATDPLAPSPRSLTLRSAVAMGDGAFLITRVPPAARLAWVAGIGEGAFARTLDRAPRLGEVLDLGVIELPAKGGICGRVLEEDGRPLVGAEVSAVNFGGHGRALADLAIRFRQDLLRRDTRFAVERRVNGGEFRYDVIAPPPALIAAVGGIGIPCATTDESGRFELRGIESASTGVVATFPGRMGAYRMGVSAQRGERKDIGDLVVERLNSIRGQVRESTGEPIANAEILIGPTAFEGTIHALVPTRHTDASGEFAASGLPDRPLLIAARRHSDDPWTVLPPHSLAATHDVVLPASTPLVLRVVAPPGLDVSRATLRIAAFAGVPTPGFGLDWAVDAAAAFESTDVERWESRPLPHGDYTLRIAVPGASEVQRTLHHDGVSEHRIELVRGHSLALVVRDRAGRPIEGACARLTRRAPEDWQRTEVPFGLRMPRFASAAQASAYSNDRGEIVLQRLPAAEYQLLVSHPEVGRCVESIAVPRERLELALVPYPIVRGQLLADGVSPARPRSVRLESLRLADGRQDFVFTTLTDASGRFEFSTVIPGTYRLSSAEPERTAPPLAALGSLWSPRWSVAATSTEIEVPTTGECFVWHEESPNRAAPTELALEVVGTVRVHGVPAPGMRIDVISNLRAKSAEPVAARSAKTSATGDYAVTAVRAPRNPEATCRIMLFDRAGVLLLTRTDVALKDEVTRVDFDLQLATVSGTVRDGNSAPVVCQVSFVGGNDGIRVSRQVATAADGTYALADLPLGNYTLRAFCHDGNAEERAVEIAVGSNRRDVVLFPLGRVSGSVALAPLRAAGGASTEPFLAVLFQRSEVANCWPSTVLEEGGAFVFEKVNPGRYELRILANGQWYRVGSEFELKDRDIEIDGSLPIATEPPEQPVLDFIRRFRDEGPVSGTGANR